MKKFFKHFFFATFLLLASNLFFLKLFEQTQDKQTYVDLLFAKTFLNVPILGMIVLFSVTISFLVACYRFVLQKRQEKKVEKLLQTLVQGDYEKLQDKDFFVDQEFQKVQTSVELLGAKMQQMSRKLQEMDLEKRKNPLQNEEEIIKKERLRISRELHDSVSQQLFAATMILSGINEKAQKDNLNEKLQQQLKLVVEVLHTAQTEMRALLLHLRPIELSDQSLKKGIEQLLKELQTKINIQLVWEIEDLKLAENIEDHLFRIVQELLSNTLRHAKASKLEVYLHQHKGNVQMRVVDDGVGFDLFDEKGTSYGLKGIKERVESLGGRVKIVSLPKQGTSVDLQIPII